VQVHDAAMQDDEYDDRKPRDTRQHPLLAVTKWLIATCRPWLLLILEIMRLPSHLCSFLCILLHEHARALSFSGSTTMARSNLTAFFKVVSTLTDTHLILIDMMASSKLIQSFFLKCLSIL